MPEVNLARPAFVKEMLRYPIENPITVSDDDAVRLKASGSLDEGADDGLDGLTVADLKELAASDKIDLGEATKKAEILAIIRAHSAPAPDA